ncbi:efflux transporter outer membrane subunit [Alcaligenaceae bacterium CGII-47]|nr:efflux transporter outer membrane subunit [Alcaligenaceae bacterium CGII-47]
MRLPNPARLLVLSSLALALSACSLAPTYERPSAPVPAAFPGQGAQVEPASTDMAALPDWQSFFLDARLKALIELALANNRDMRIAVQRVQEARAQYGIAQSDQWPTLGVGGTGQITRSPENIRQSNSSSVSRVYQAGLGMTSFELDFFGRVRNLSEAAYEQYLATDEAQRTVHINLVAQTAEAYFQLRTAQALHELITKTLRARTSTLDLVQAQFDVGVVSELDLMQARSLLDTARADLAAVERRQAQAGNALQLILGMLVPEDLPPGAEFGRNQLLAAIPVGLPSDLLERRPDIIGAEHALKAANAQIGAARAAFFPRISITGLLGFASPELGALFGSSHRYWQFSPQIQMPLFSGGVSGNLDLAKARQHIAVSTYEKAIQTAFREVADTLAGEATYSRELDAMRATEASALKILELSKVRYETGVDSFLQVQTAEVNLYGVQNTFIQLGAQALTNRVELYKALGGGWGTVPSTSEVQG